MSADPDKELADALSRTPKIVRDAIIWEALDEHRHRFTVRVYAPEMKVVLELVGNIGRTNNSFALLYRKYPIRRLDLRGRHKSPDGRLFNGHHKHIWDETHEDRFCYTPEDIDPEDDIDAVLFAFLEEENIQFEGSYQGILLR
jgi:hypothetical protein